MEFRKSELDDIPGIMHIIEKAKLNLKDAGIDQWQNGYPNEAVIKEDITRGESYVALLHGNLVGTVAITFGVEHHYDTIRDGEWMNQDGFYAVIHRIAVDQDYKGKGIAGYLLSQAEVLGKDKIESIRIDTHEKNIPMQRAIKKQGFELCGKITLLDGTDRITFEKWVDSKGKQR